MKQDDSDGRREAEIDGTEHSEAHLSLPVRPLKNTTLSTTLSNKLYCTVSTHACLHRVELLTRAEILPMHVYTRLCTRSPTSYCVAPHIVLET
jgi:hypothetical protein